MILANKRLKKLMSLLQEKVKDTAGFSAVFICRILAQTIRFYPP
jgi:hypothetical protein